jgi:hypothetical protein
MTNDRWEQQQHREREFHASTAATIVDALNRVDAAGWTIAHGDERHYSRAVTTTGENFSLSYDRHKNRIHVSGNWPAMPDGRFWYPRYGDESPGITVSADRAPDAVAKDIARRFLPAYRTLLAKARAEVRGAQEYRNATERNFAELVAAGAPYIRPHQGQNNGDERTASIYDAPGVSYGTIRVGGQSVQFDRLSMTPEFATKFAAFIAAQHDPDDR